MSSVRIGGSGSDGESQRGAAVIKCWVGATETSCPGDRRGACGNGVRPQRAPKSPLHSLAGGAGRGGGEEWSPITGQWSFFEAIAGAGARGERVRGVLQHLA